MNYTFEQIYKIIQKHFRFIIIVSIGCAVMGLLLTLVLPKKYKSTGSFYIVNSSTNTGGIDLLKGLISGTSTGDSKIYIENLIQTRFIMDDIIRKTSLMEKKSIKKNFIAYDWLKENIAVSPLKDGLILLSAVDNDPAFATLLTNSYLEVIDSFYKESEIFLARNYRKYLEVREKELLSVMESRLDSLKSFQKRENLVYPEIEYESYYTNIVMPLKQELTNQLINKEKALIVLNDKSSYEQYDRESKITEAVIDSLYNSVSSSNQISLAKLPSKIKEYVALKIQSDISITLYTTVKAELEKAVLNEKNTVPSIYVIDRGEMPETHIFPKKRDGIILGLFLGLILSMIYSIYKESKPSNA